MIKNKIIKITILAFPWLVLSPAYSAFNASLDYEYLDYKGYSTFSFDKEGDRRLVFSDDERSIYLSLLKDGEGTKVFAFEEYEGNAEKPERKIILEGTLDPAKSHRANNAQVRKRKDYSLDLTVRAPEPRP
ncbi:MAG: hypothetical protein R3A80_03870 [Bdellovibrionota bacterium]